MEKFNKTKLLCNFFSNVFDLYEEQKCKLFNKILALMTMNGNHIQCEDSKLLSWLVQVMYLIWHYNFWFFVKPWPVCVSLISFINLPLICFPNNLLFSTLWILVIFPEPWKNSRSKKKKKKISLWFSGFTFGLNAAKWKQCADHWVGQAEGMQNLWSFTGVDLTTTVGPFWERH